MASAWSAADDAWLWGQIQSGHLSRTPSHQQLKQIAERFGRNDGAIRSRLRHLQDPKHSAYARLHRQEAQPQLSPPQRQSVGALDNLPPAKRQALGALNSSHHQSLSENRTEAGDVETSKFDVTVTITGSVAVGPLDAAWLKAFKSAVPGMKYVNSSQLWSVPTASLPQLATLLQQHGIAVPADVRAAGATSEKDALVEPSSENASIEAIKYSFVSLRALQTRPLPCTVDLCGIVVSAKPQQPLTGKEGQELVKREVTLADDSSTSMTVTLWGDQAKQEDKAFEGNPVILLKSVVVKEWRNTRAGSLLQRGAMALNSTVLDLRPQRVKQWWFQGGSSQTLLNLTPQGAGSGNTPSRNTTWTTLAGLRLASERLSGQPELFNIVARLAVVQLTKQGKPQPLHYMACQEPKEAGKSLPCNKRVDESGFCPACKRAGKVAPRVFVRCSFVDFEDQTWLTSFHESATVILGMSAEEVRDLEVAAKAKGENGREELDESIRKHYFEKPINITVRAKMGSYNGEPRADVAVIDARPVSHAEHGRQMLKEIQEMLANGAQAGA